MGLPPRTSTSTWVPSVGCCRRSELTCPTIQASSRICQQNRVPCWHDLVAHDGVRSERSRSGSRLALAFRELRGVVRILRGLVGAILWIVAAVLGLVSIVLCITVILLPIGLALLSVTRRLFGMAVRLMLPRDVAHPVQQGRKQLKRKAHETSKQAKRSKPGKAAAKAGRTAAKTGRKAQKRLKK